MEYRGSEEGRRGRNRGVNDGGATTVGDGGGWDGAGS